MESFEFYNPDRIIFDQQTLNKTFSTAECMYPNLTVADPEIMTSVLFFRGDHSLCHGVCKSSQGKSERRVYPGRAVVPHFDIHHGACMGVITPRWMRHVVEKAPDMFARFAETIFGITQGETPVLAVCL